MKYIKIFMSLVAVALLGSCSSDGETWNSASDVTVSMANETMTVNEGKGLFNVPIQVTGKTNGRIKVTVEVSEVGDYPAKEDKNYYVTGKTIYISDSTANVEIKTVDDEEINNNRTFAVTIVSAEGAKLGNTTTTVTLKDNDAEFYQKLQGKWTMTGTDRSGNELSWNVTITGASDEKDEDYNKYLYITGLNGYSSCEAVLTYNYDISTKSGYVAFDELGGESWVLGAYNFGSTLGACYVVPFNYLNGQLTTTPIVGHWSDDFKTVTFDEGMLFGRLYTYSTFEDTGYYWFAIQNIKLTK